MKNKLNQNKKKSKLEKETSKLIQKDKNKSHAILELAPDGMVIVNQKGLITFINKQFEILFSVERKNIIGSPLSNLIPERFNNHSNYLKSYFKDPEVRPMGIGKELVGLKNDGTKFPVDVSLSPLETEEGQFVLAAVRDITERKLVEEKLQLRSKIVENMAEGIYLIRVSDGLIVYTNPKFEQMFGYDSGELIGQHVSIVNAPSEKSPEETANEIMQCLKEEGSWSGEIKNINKMGVSFWCRANVSTIDHPEYGQVWISLHEDITSRKKVEEALKKNEKGLAEAQRIAHIGNWELNILDKKLTWSDEIYRIFGMEPQSLEANFEIFLKYVHPDDREMVNKAYTDSLISKTPYEINHRLKLTDGSVKYVNEKCVTHFDNKGKPLRSIGTVQDITELIVAQQKILASEKKFRILIENNPVGILITNRAGEILELNQATAKMFGFNSKIEMLGHFVTEFYSNPEDRKEYLESIKKGSLSDFEVLFKQKNGATFLAKVNSTVQIDPDGDDFYINVIEDITIDKEYTEQLEKEVNERTRELEKTNQELHTNLQDMERFNKLVIGRENYIIKLKKEVNDLLLEHGKSKKYKIFS